MIGAHEFNRAEIVAEVGAVFAQYEAALLAHDVVALNAWFLQRVDTARFGIAEHNYGAAEISRWRQSTAAVHPQRRLLKVIVATYGADVATVSAEFEAPDSAARGRQTQVWVRSVEGWRIAAAHVSLIDAQLLGEPPGT